MIKYLDTFAGVGGFHLALENIVGKENIDCIGFSEIDKFAKQVYKEHFPDSKDLGDITKINIDNLPEFDLLTGGFPCQDVSVAGKQNLDGGRTELVEYLLQILEKKHPKYFVFENVKGLMGKKFDTFRESIFERISEAGYGGNHKVLNTKNFGLPQNRERVFMVGILEGSFEFPKGQELTTFLKDVLNIETDEVGENKILMSKVETTVRIRKNKVDIEGLKQTLRDNRKPLKSISEHLNIPKTKVEHWFRKDNCFAIPDENIWLKLKEYLDISTNEFDKSIMEFEIREGTFDMSKRVYNINGISPTLTTGGQTHMFTDGNYTFLLDTITAERLQGFTAGWSSGIVSNTQVYKQMGNAISVPVVEAIFSKLFN